MTQHGDGNRWVSNDQSQNLPLDADFLDPGTVIDRGEQAETARPYVRLNFFSVRVPAFGVVGNFVDQERFVSPHLAVGLTTPRRNSCRSRI